MPTLTCTTYRDDDAPVEIRFDHHRGQPARFSAMTGIGQEPIDESVELYEADDGGGWRPIEDVPGIDLARAEEAAWEAVEARAER